MLISKVKEFWTAEQLAEFDRLTEEYNRLWEEIPIEKLDQRPANWEALEEIDQRRNDIISSVTEKYIKSFARRKTAIYDDITEIVEAITKEDYLESIKDFITILKNLKDKERVNVLKYLEDRSKENYQNCYNFISGQLTIQMRVIKYYNLDRAKVKTIIDKQVSKWYVNNFPDYIPTAHGTATDQLGQLTTNDIILDSITGAANYERDNFKLSIEDYQKLKGKLGVNTHKLLMYGVGQFTRANNRNTQQDSNLQISFFLKDYARLLGYRVDEDPAAADPVEEKKRAQRVLNEAQKKIKRELDLLFALSLQWQENIKGKTKDFDNVRILGRVSVRKGVVNMEFTRTMGEYLKSLPITQFPVTQYRIDGRNPNAYALGNKFAQHFNMDNNQKRGTANRLKVETLLKCCPDIATIEQVIQNRNSWEERIKDRFENALDEVTRAGTISSWKYTHAKGLELTDEEAQNITDYNTFKDLYITFEMGADIDHTERLERQEERKQLTAPTRTRRKRSSGTRA